MEMFGEFEIGDSAGVQDVAGQPQMDSIPPVDNPGGAQPAITSQPSSGHLYMGHSQPSVKMRLEQAKNFLADEDFHRCLDFDIQLQQLDDYVKWLEGSEEDYDRNDLKEIQDMIAVHQSWMKDAIEATPDPPWEGIRLKHSDRLLPWHHIARLRERYEDAPASSLRLSGRMKETALTIPLTAEERGPEVDPFHFTKKVSEIRQKQDALTATFQGQEATLYGGSKAYVRAPANYDGPYVPTKKVQVENGVAQQLNSLIFVLHKLLHAHNNAPRSFLAALIMEIQKGICYQSNPAEEAAQLEAQLQSVDTRQGVDVIREWLDVQRTRHENTGQQPTLPNGSALSLTDDPLVSDAETALLLSFAEQSWNSKRSAITFEGRSTFEDRYSQAEHPNWTLSDKYSTMATFARRAEELFAGYLFPRLDIAIDVLDLLSAINNIAAREGQLFDGRNRPAAMQTTVDQAVYYLDRMQAASQVRWNRATRKVQKPIPDRHPEDRYLPEANPDAPKLALDENRATGLPVQPDISFLFKMARRLGQEILRLVIWMASKEHADGEQAPAAAKLDDFIVMPNSATITELQDANILEGQTDDEDLSATLQLAIINELNMNADVRAAPDFEKVWAFSNSKAPDKSFFSLDRWPPRPSQKGGDGRLPRQNRLPKGPSARVRPPKADREEGSLLENKHGNELARIRREQKKARNLPQGEVHFKGETAYPFGETVIQQSWLNHQLDEELKDVPEFAYIYNPKPKPKPKPKGKGKGKGIEIERETSPSTVEDRYKLPDPPADWTPSSLLPKAPAAPPAAIPAATPAAAEAPPSGTAGPSTATLQDRIKRSTADSTDGEDVVPSRAPKRARGGRARRARRGN